MTSLLYALASSASITTATGLLSEVDSPDASGYGIASIIAAVFTGLIGLVGAITGLVRVLRAPAIKDDEQ